MSVCRPHHAALLAGVVSLACSGSPASDPDAAQPADATVLVDAPPVEVPPFAATRPRYLAVAPDGTVYVAPYDHAGRIVRWRSPGELTQPWVDLAGAPRIFGVAVHPTSGRVYVAAGDGLWELDPGASPPTPVRFAPYRPHAVAVGPDGAIYHTRTKEGRYAIYRSTTATDDAPVTANDFVDPSDLLVDDDGSLLLLERGNSTVVRIEVGPDHLEIRRTGYPTAAQPEAIARDQAGRYYLAAAGKLMRFPAGTNFGGGEELTTGGAAVGLTSDLAFAHGALGAVDLFLARPDASPLRLAVGVGGRP